MRVTRNAKVTVALHSCSGRTLCGVEVNVEHGAHPVQRNRQLSGQLSHFIRKEAAAWRTSVPAQKLIGKGYCSSAEECVDRAAVYSQGEISLLGRQGGALIEDA